MDLMPTPIYSKIPPRAADFGSLAEALDYAATGETGCDFYGARGELTAAVPYKLLRRQARTLARRLLSLELESGACVPLVAETGPDFLRFFFACQYAGLVAVPVPTPVSLGSRKAYVDLLQGMLRTCRASIAVAPTAYLPFMRDAANGLDVAVVGDAAHFDELPESSAELHRAGPDDVAYLQFTSGSTRSPRGVMVTQQSVMSNLRGIVTDGVKLGPGDRCVSWLPFYHDMGLVGLVLVPVAAQVSVDYLATRDFAMRPRQWLSLMSRTRGTVSFGPPFGYDLCARRLRPGEAEAFDLSAWRVAGVGAEMIHPSILERFAEAVRPSGFDPNAFLPCYGMAECSLAVSFSALNGGMRVDNVEAAKMESDGLAAPVADPDGHGCATKTVVDCGVPLPELDVEIRDSAGRVLPDRQVGGVFVRGPSVMSGYFGDPDATAKVLSSDGWLETGDLGYRVKSNLFITGRRKDLIIINGRNVWPQDLEYLAEQQPEIRAGDCLAFSAPGPEGQETAVMVVQCRENEPAKRQDLIRRIKAEAYSDLGVECHVELVPLHTLPRTTSGKLSRSKARQDYIEAAKAKTLTATLDAEPTMRQRRRGAA